MATVPVTHKPTPAHARQFDGSLEAMLDIINARGKNNVVVTLRFNGAGDFSHMDVSGEQAGGSLSLDVGDWAVFPDDPAQPAFSLPAARAGDDWQPA